MRILIATDAWHPQVNGVVRSIEATVTSARAFGADIRLLTPEGFPNIGLPTYPDISLACASPTEIRRRLAREQPDHVHIATEGPIGFLTRMACRRDGRAFTTSYHTQFPAYLAARAPIPQVATYAALRWFHNGGIGTMVSTQSIADTLSRRGFARVMRWSRGVDHTLYRPRARSMLDLPRPIFLSVGRVAVEKNLEAFLALPLPGSKVIVGDGPARAALEARFPAAHFLGAQSGETLAETYASADVFVFPSRTDTFGIVLLEALASGLPVAAYPVAGPIDVLGGTGAGVLDEDLGAACRAALAVPRHLPREHALGFSWQESTGQFLRNIEHARQACSLLRPKQSWSARDDSVFTPPLC